MQTEWISHEQGSEDWHKWRDGGSGGSDACVIAGVSTFTNRTELWKEKTGKKVRKDLGYIGEIGKKIEPLCEAYLEKNYGLKFEPRCCQRKDVNWARSSLDGYCESENIISEYKYASKKDHANVLATKEVPKKYYPQLQWNMYVSDTQLCYYVSYWGKGDDYAVLKITRDDTYIEDLLKKARDFRECVNSKTPPSELPTQIEGEPKWQAAATVLANKKAKLDKAKEAYDAARDKLISLTKFTKVYGEKVSISRVQAEKYDYLNHPKVKAAIDALTPEELKEILVKSKPSWKLTFSKPKESKDGNNRRSSTGSK